MIKKGFICNFNKLIIEADCIYNDNLVAGDNIRVRIIDKDKGIGINKGLKSDYTLYSPSIIFEEKDRQTVSILLRILRDEKAEYEAFRTLTVNEIMKRAIRYNGSLAIS